ncbi:hypothetical protein C8A00DRAFT_18863 [Chaetomidium leptoderma]|uniref:Uncharacterized protein n=1 Tax=Chaetomidium leptoderma TaxID=669021 RepID=A0AAN6VEM9_9PEZI|nr:hypothetical protein C8A00DRAFT_18863 [Chaetomidium leptoderma]
MSDISDEKYSHLHVIYEDLQRLKEDKWGWVIYRTTYKDDAGWDRFKSYVKKWSDDDFSKPGVPRGLSAGGWTFVSDPALDGASREQLRHHFREWRKTAWHTENPRRKLAFPTSMSDLSPRYIMFIQVDEESLNSVLDGTGDITDPAWVHLVRCDDDLDVGVQPPFQHPRTDQWVVDEGWMMIAASNIHGSFYVTIGNVSDSWDVFYMVPPDVQW